jgi:hypothetical protein
MRRLVANPGRDDPFVIPQSSARNRIPLGCRHRFSVGKENGTMFRIDEQEHHRERVRAELDLAYRAVSPAAADAHLRLSALHMRRLAELGHVRTTDEPALVDTTH